MSNAIPSKAIEQILKNLKTVNTKKSNGSQTYLGFVPMGSGHPRLHSAPLVFDLYEEFYS